MTHFVLLPQRAGKAGVADPDPVLQQREREVQIIISQYRRLAGEINRLFNALSQKTQTEDWRVDGIGTCAAGPYVFADGMTGIAVSRFQKLWREITRDRSPGKIMGHRACPHHAKDEGCVLGDLKPARCLSYIEQESDEIERLTGMSVSALGVLIRDALETVMLGEIRDPDPSTHLVYPERNEEFVAQKMRQFGALTKRVEAYLPSS